MYEVIPGILEKEWSRVEEKIKFLTPFAKTLHIDIIDNKFAPNLTILDPSPFRQYKDQFFLEAHMMVENPQDYIDGFAQAGFKRFIAHIEAINQVESFIQAVKQSHMEVCLAVDGPTPVAKLFPFVELVDCFLVYVSDKVGFAGPPMMPKRLEKVKALAAKTNLPIEVDGGVKDTTIQLAKEAGATRFVATSFISSASHPYEAFLKLKTALE